MAASETLTKTFSFKVFLEKVDDHGQFYPNATENSYKIDFVGLKKFCDNDLPNQNLNTCAVKKETLSKIINALNISAMTIVYENKIPKLECEIKNKCSAEAWEIYHGVREVIPFIAKLTEYLKLFTGIEQMHENSDADDNRRQIDCKKALQTQMNKCEMDLKKYECDLSLMEDDIKKFKEKVETIESNDECISEGRLKDIKILLERLQQDRSNQIPQIQDLIKKQDSNLNKLKEMQETEARVQETESNYQKLDELVKSLNEQLRQKSEENNESRERCGIECAKITQYENTVRQLNGELVSMRDSNEESTNQITQYENTVRQLNGELVSMRDSNEESTNQGHTTRENICTICKRITWMVEKCSEIQQQCPCCVLRRTSQDQPDRLVDSWEIECFCCRCLAQKVRNDIIDIVIVLENHSQDLRGIHSGTGWQL